MKKVENAARPRSAMVYLPSRGGPLSWSGRPAQTSLNSLSNCSTALTPP